MFSNIVAISFHIFDAGEVGVAAPFTIDTRGAGNGSLGLTVEGPCEAKIDCTDNGNGSCSVRYLPTEPGDYQINILFADQHIPGSPFTAYVKLRLIRRVIFGLVEANMKLKILN